MVDNPFVEYDPTELVFRTMGAERGTLHRVTLWPEEEDAQRFLFRVGEDHPGPRIEGLVVQACLDYLDRRYGEGGPQDFDYDFESIKPGATGAWVPAPGNGYPVEVDTLGTVLSVGRPPLGATRGKEGDPNDYRWVYVALRWDDTTPHHPLKRLVATTRELSRVTNQTQAARINYPLRDAPVFLRLSRALPRAALLVPAAASDPLCHLRLDLFQLIRWLSRQMENR